ncbi:MAG: S1 RNA-binding domain-containing protein [Vicinamibacterales bacterium]
MSEQEDEDFAALFEASIKTAKHFERGQVVDGTIVSIGPKVALVNIGAKSEAEIDVSELKDHEGDIEVAVGDRIQAKVVGTAGGLVLSRRGVRSAATQRELEDAHAAGLAVEGRVERAVKGGFEVKIGRERAFCPISQIDIVRTVDPAVHEGKVYAFRIIEMKGGGKDLVVSRRAALEEEQRAQADAVRASVIPGAVLPGRVASVLDYGAFVDLGGGVQGLLHASEMSWSRATRPAEIVQPGDEITVKVLRVDEESGRIGLGLKQLQNDPWTTVAASYEVGQVREGRVTRLADFGAFVELEPGIEALAHASTFPPTGGLRGWMKAVPPGTTAAFEILSVDVAQKRIGVAMVEEGSSRASGAREAQAAIVPGALVTGKVERHDKVGVFVFLAPGRTGLMHAAETGLDRDADLKKAFPVGSEVQVVVLDVGEGGRRIRLSKKAVAEQQEKAELQDYAQRQDQAAAPSLSTLAEKLRGALGGR